MKVRTLYMFVEFYLKMSVCANLYTTYLPQNEVFMFQNM